MELGKNKALIGFVDLLTGFLASALVLMLIFSFSLNKGGDVAGGPRDFMLYQVEVEGSGAELLKVKLFVKPPDSKWLETKIDDNGNAVITNNHLLDLDSKKFYAWGPVRVFDENGKLVKGKVIYNIYGVSLLNGTGKWDTGILIYDRSDFDKNSYKNELDKDFYSQRIHETYKIKHIINTRMVNNYTDYQTVSLGSFSDISMNVVQKKE